MMFSLSNKDFSDDDGWFIGRSATNSRANTPSSSRASTPQHSPLLKAVFTEKTLPYTLSAELSLHIDQLLEEDRKETAKIKQNTPKPKFTPLHNSKRKLAKQQKKQAITKKDSEFSLTFDLAFGEPLPAHGIASNKSSYASIDAMEDAQPRLTPELRM